MSLAFPGETAEYRKARDQLLEAGIDLRRAMERVAELRRQLSLGGVVPDDYAFQDAGLDGRPAQVRLPAGIVGVPPWLGPGAERAQQARPW